jgi:hypothetical protein
MAGNPLEIVTKFTSDVSGLQKGANEAKDAIGGISPAALLTGATVVGAAALAVGAIASMTQAAADDEAQQVAVEQAYKNSGAATGDYVQGINDAIAAGQAKAFTDTETRAALTSLITATGDAKTATADLATAQDIARFSGVDLSTAADAVAKAHAGQDGALRKLLPGLEKGATAMDTLKAAQDQAAGSADVYAATTQGQMAVAGDAFSELGETLGTAFIPLVRAILPPIIKIIELMGVLISAIIPPLSVLFGALGTIIGVVISAVIPLVTWIGTLIAKLGPTLTPILRTVVDVLGKVGDAIGGVVGWIQKLVDWIGTAIGKIGDFLSSLNPLQGFSLPSLPFSLAAPGASVMGMSAGAGSRAAGGAGSGTSSGITVNVYGGDPRRITEAVAAGYRRWVDINGRTAPTRDY